MRHIADDRFQISPPVCPKSHYRRAEISANDISKHAADGTITSGLRSCA